MPKVNQDILEWARRSAGLTVEEAAEKLKLNAARGVAGADRLRALEQGTEAPTRQLLLRMSKQYRRPLLTFYMSAPPRKGDRGEDFRTVPQQHQAGSVNVWVDAVIRDVRARQGMVRSLLEDAGEANRLPFVGSTTLAQPIARLVTSISSTIRITSQQYQAAGSPEEGFAMLRAGAERAGVFVLLIGDLGSHHTAIDVEAFRGFALADDVAPFVVVNHQDARTAWGFTLIHELAHLWLGATGVSGSYAETKLERHCNMVASELLLPRHQLAEVRVATDTAFDVVLRRISDFSRPKNLSGTMVAYRLYAAGAITLDMFEQLRTFFRHQWRAHRANARAEAREQEGGPSYYVVRRHRVGEALIGLARRTMAEGLLSPTKAAKLLGVKAMNVHELVQSGQ